MSCGAWFYFSDLNTFFFYSGYHLIQTAFDIKQEYTGATGTYAKNLKRTEFWKIPEVRLSYWS